MTLLQVGHLLLVREADDLLQFFIAAHVVNCRGSVGPQLLHQILIILDLVKNLSGRFFRQVGPGDPRAVFKVTPGL